MKKPKNIASTVTKLLSPVIEELGYLLWDIEYLKEGTEWFLRITIDSDNGISLEDCERVHRAADPILDAHDPIEGSYRLEVSSPGIERELRTDSHFAASIGEEIEIKLYAAKEGKKSIRGVLVAYENKIITIKDSVTEQKIDRADTAKVNIVYDF